MPYIDQYRYDNLEDELEIAFFTYKEQYESMGYTDADISMMRTSILRFFGFNPADFD